MKIKSLIAFLCLIAISVAFFNSKSDSTSYFEGKIVFKTKFNIKDSTEFARTLSKMLPDTVVSYFKEGNFFEINNKGEVQSSLYLRDSNNIYSNKWSKDTLYSFNCGRPGRKIISCSIRKSIDTILKIPCNELIIEYPQVRISYFFNPDTLKINPGWHKMLTYINRDTISKITRSMILGTRFVYPDCEMISEAVYLSKEKVPVELFRIPKTCEIIEEK